MAERKAITCPQCGKLLGQTSNPSGGGTKYCSNCRKTIGYDITASSVHTYVKR